MKKKFGLVVLLSTALMLNGNSSIITFADVIEQIDVTTAKSNEEKLQVAYNELSLNIDLKTIVTDISLSYKGLFGCSITWVSNNENYVKIDDTLKRAVVTRPSSTTGSVNVKLTATLTMFSGTDNEIKKEKDFDLTILPKSSTSSSEPTSNVVETTLFEDFNQYSLGEDIGEYLSWNVTGGEGLTEIVNAVPNNNIIEGKNVLKINSKKQASEVKYITNFYQDVKTTVEGFIMVDGQVNKIHFEAGKNDIFGASIGIDHNSFYYYNNGDKVIDKDTSGKVFPTPVQDVWYKFRIDAIPSSKVYTLSLYSFDGNNTLLKVKTAVIPGTDKYLNQFRIRVEGGDKTGSVYLADLKIDKTENLPINEGINPNRTDGIGNIDNFTESVLYTIGNEKDYDKNFIVHNRFDDSKIYELNTDYTISKETLTSTDSYEENKYVITLLATNETKELFQQVYKEETTGLPSIIDFKASHLTKEVLNAETGQIASTGSITFTGYTNRDDSTIYYGLKKVEEDAPTLSDLKAGTGFVSSGSYEQTTRNIKITIANLSFNYEYNLYVVISNANGDSKMYSKEEISEVINIETCEDFYDMTVNVNTYTNEFRLTKDLDFKDYTWVCDPTNTLKWKGSLDGQGHTISNLSILSPQRKAAIFFEITDATIQNLTIVDPIVSGTQDSAVVCGYSNGGTIQNVNIINPKVTYNNNDGSEGYFAIVAGRLHQGTTYMNNICIKNAYISCNKYTGLLTGNVNKDKNCVLNVNNCYAEGSIWCEGAAIGLIGRNRGTTNINNTIAKLNIISGKKELAVVAGHNKEGGILNVKNFIGYLTVQEISQPTYFNYFIGSQDDSTSKYSFENVYFVEGDFSSVTDNFAPINTSRTCGSMLTNVTGKSQQWWEEHTFINAFEVDKVWSYDETTKEIVYDYGKKTSVKAEQVTELINAIKGDYSSNDHYYISKALTLYNALSSTEKAKVDYAKLQSYEASYNEFINKISNISSVVGGK